MGADFRRLSIITSDYSGPDRRYQNERRVAFDRRSMVRFDHNGGDRRSGFSRRNTDDGLLEQDFV
jgi:hypothetical protein